MNLKTTGNFSAILTLSIELKCLTTTRTLFHNSEWNYLIIANKPPIFTPFIPRVVYSSCSLWFGTQSKRLIVVKFSSILIVDE